MRHNFENIFSYQWGMAGDSWDSAHSIFKCRTCGQGFTHWYHREPSIYKAMEQEGINIDGCPGVLGISSENPKEGEHDITTEK